MDRDEPPEKKVKLEDNKQEHSQDVSSNDAGLLPAKSESPANDDGLLEPPKGTLPPLLLILLQTIISTLRTSFSASPPYTSQRLAELILHPREHYRTLPSYLRALDRIVSVASPASIFPLKNLTAATTSTNGTLLNGMSSPSPDPADDADFIGGAELTEIPWAPKPVAAEAGTEGMYTTTNGAAANASDLRTESTSLIDGPNGPGGVETVTVTNGIITPSTVSREDSIIPTPITSSVNATDTSAPQHGITQGEILRQEQEAGIVPVPSPTHSSQSGTSSRVTRSSTAASAVASRAIGTIGPDRTGDSSFEEPAASDEEVVHARGPGVIGMEDMGPQAPGSGLEGGIEVEGALGRRGDIIPQPLENSEGNAQHTGATQELDGMNLHEEVKLEENQEGDESAAEATVEKDGEDGRKIEDKDAMMIDSVGVSEVLEGKDAGQSISSNTGGDDTAAV